MQRPKSAKHPQIHTSKSAALPGEGVQSEDRQLAHAFDVVVPNAPVEVQHGGPPSAEMSEPAADRGRTEEEIVRELHAAQELAKKTQYEIEKRIREVRRRTRRTAA